MKCPVCEKEFISKTGRRPKKFCSDSCKVRFWNSKKKKVQDLTKPTNEVKPTEQPKSNYVATVEPDVQGKIAAYEAELEASTSNAPIAIQRRKWLQNKIWQLKGIVK